MAKIKTYTNMTYQEYGKKYYESHKQEAKDWYEKNKSKIQEKRKQLRKKISPVVYLWAVNGSFEYVGRGSLSRARNHKSYSPWWTPQHLLVTMTCDNEWHAMEMEGKWGGRYLPKQNKDGYRYTGK